MKRALRLLTINAGLVLLVMVAAELIFGNWFFGPDYSVLNVPRNEKRYFDVSEFIEPGKVITYTRDQHGLRGDYGGDPANIDVLVMGGSTTNERFLDDKETWVSRLQLRFRKSGRSLSIVNAAIDGQSTVGHIAAVHLWFSNIPGLKPNYILALVGVNDVVVGGTNQRYDLMKSPEFSRQARQYVMNHSVLYNQFRRIRGMFVAHRTRLMHGANAYKNGKWIPVLDWTDRAKLAQDLKVKLAGYRTRLTVLALRIRGLGAEPIFITQRRGDYRFEDGRLKVLVPIDQPPTQVAPSDRGMLQMTLFNEVTLSVCRERKMTCVDLDGDIEFGPDDFYDGVHTMPSGSAKIANFLFENLNTVLK